MATVQQLTFGDGTAAAPAAGAPAAGPGYEIERELAAARAGRVAGVDDLPRWRHLKRHRPDVEGQLSLL